MLRIYPTEDYRMHMIYAYIIYNVIPAPLVRMAIVSGVRVWWDWGGVSIYWFLQAAWSRCHYQACHDLRFTTVRLRLRAEVMQVLFVSVAMWIPMAVRNHKCYFCCSGVQIVSIVLAFRNSKLHLFDLQTLITRLPEKLRSWESSSGHFHIMT